MNINPQETRQQTDMQPANAENVSSVNKPEEVEAKTSEFKKFIEETKNTEKLQPEQVILPNNPNAEINNEYINKFSFDMVSEFKDIKPSYNYDSMMISKDDAKFFADLVENKQFALQQAGDNTNLIKFSDEIGPTYKSQQTSQVLTDLINKAYNDQKPVRIDFDNNVSVIIKIDQKGKVSAEFIPGDKAVEAYLRNNIGFLKQRFDDQNLAYNDILYRQSNQNNQNRNRQKKDKGE